MTRFLLSALAPALPLYLGNGTLHHASYSRPDRRLERRPFNLRGA